MKIWLLKDGENLPIQQDVSKMRTWMLAEELVARGHMVTWWSSTHSHQLKKLVHQEDLDQTIAPGLRLVLLDCGGYSKNRSLARYVHHRRLARRFLERAYLEERPDLVLSSFPTIDFANAGVDAAQHFGCLSVVDIRDPWPDVALNLYNGVLRSLLALVFKGMDNRARRCFRRTDVMLACSEGFLKWGLTKANRERASGDRVFYIGRPASKEVQQSVIPKWLAKIPTDKFLLSFLGAFGQVYELELICEAAATLLRSGSDRFHFVLAGDGDKGEKIRKLASNLENVTVPGWISKSDSRALLSMSSLGLAPYKQLPGCMPNKIFEYVAAGLPVISSLEGDVPELLSEYSSGLSYIAGDVNGFISCVRGAVQSDIGLAAMSRNATTMFQARFTAQDIYRDYAQHLEELVNVGHG